MGFLMTRKMGTGGLQNLTFGYQYAYEARDTRALLPPSIAIWIHPALINSAT